MRFKKKTMRDTLEARLDDLAEQTEDVRKQVAERAPVVRDQLLDLIPDRDQLLEMRDDLFERMPDSVTDRLPEKVKPKKSRVKRIAVIGVITGAGAAAFAVLRRKGTAPTPSAPFPEPARPAAAPTKPPVAPPVATTKADTATAKADTAPKTDSPSKPAAKSDAQPDAKPAAPTDGAKKH